MHRHLRSAYSRTFQGILVLFACCWLSACATGSSGYESHEAGGTGDASSTERMLEHRQAREIDTLNEKLMSQAQLHVDPADYLLGSGDLLQIDVFEAEELCTKARISSRGFVTLPLLGQIKLNGMTAREAENLIEEAFAEKYIKDPHVSIFVEEHYSQRVTLVGQFKNPGTYDYYSKQRLLDVLALGGGLTDKAARTVQIRRMGTTPEEDERPSEGVFYVDLDRLIGEGATELNVEINGGDVLYVAEAGEYFVDGAVRRPGSFSIRQGTTLQEAVVAAGGLAPYANKSEIVIVRNDKGQREILKIDTSEPENWNFPVEDQDVIVAKSSALGRLWHGFSIRIFGVGYSDPER
ncbi:MAG: SLBB domain-containing protein [Thermodesulfobacteriota bacterium]